MPFCEHTVAAGLPQGRYIASKRVRCRIVDILTGQVLEEEQRHGDAVTSVHFTAHGELVSSSGDRCIHLWKVAPPPSSNPPKASLRPPQLSLPPHPVRVSGGTPQAVVPAVAGHAGRGLSLRNMSTITRPTCRLWKATVGLCAGTPSDQYRWWCRAIVALPGPLGTSQACALTCRLLTPSGNVHERLAGCRSRGL